MRAGTKSIVLFGGSYLAIWSIALWVAGTTPRNFLDVSISHTGILALTSWSKSTNQDTNVQVWANDLESCQEIPCLPNAWAMSISVDGTSLIVPTDDQLVYYQVELNRVIRRSDWPELIDDDNDYALAPPTFRHLSILWNSDLLAFPTYCGGGVWRPSQQAYTEILKSYEPHVRLDWNRRYGLLGSVDLNAMKRIQRFFEFKEDGTTKLIRDVPVIDDYYFVAAVDTQGTLAIQDNDGLALTSLDGNTRDIKIPSDIGGVREYSPDGRRLLFTSRKRRQASIFDLASQEIVARIQLRDDESPREVQFQDDDHVILLIEPINADGSYDNSVNGYLKRWNWRTGKDQTLSAGFFDAAETTFWLRLVWASFALWFLTLVYSRCSVRIPVASSLHRWRPLLDLFLASLFIITVAARRVWSGADDKNVNLAIALAILFGVVSLLMLFLALSAGRWMSKIPWCLFAVAALSLGVRRFQERLDTYILNDTISSSIAGFVLLLLLLAWFMIPRRKGWRIEYPSSVSAQREPQRISRITLRDGLLLTAAVASWMAVWAGEEDYYLDADIIDVLMPCAGFTVVAAALTWLVLGSRANWGKYLLAALTIIPALILFPLFTAALVAYLILSLMLFRMHGYQLRSVT